MVLKQRIEQCLIEETVLLKLHRSRRRNPVSKAELIVLFHLPPPLGRPHFGRSQVVLTDNEQRPLIECREETVEDKQVWRPVTAEGKRQQEYGDQGSCLRKQLTSIGAKITPTCGRGDQALSFAAGRR